MKSERIRHFVSELVFSGLENTEDISKTQIWKLTKTVDRVLVTQQYIHPKKIETHFWGDEMEQILVLALNYSDILDKE